VSPTLGQLVAHTGLALEWAAGAEQAGREIRWVHASELADPAPYLEGGELLLTTGMRMTTSAPAARAYVARLVGAGVAGLGFATGISHDVVPKALVTACTAADLPLLVVPEQTPFIQISKTVSDLIAAQEREELARSLESQRALVRAAADGAGAVVARLAKEVRGWALLMDASGRPIHASSAEASARARDLLPEIERIRPKGLLAGSSLAAGGERISLQPLRSTQAADRAVTSP
jgi:purine catabolism regulator